MLKTSRISPSWFARCSNKDDLEVDLKKVSDRLAFIQALEVREL